MLLAGDKVGVGINFCKPVLGILAEHKVARLDCNT